MTNCLRAPAKINLWLKIVGTREDGYHLLHSLFAPIDLYDDIVLSFDAAGATADKITYFDKAGKALAIEGDTVSLAIRLLRTAGFSLPPIVARITKGIPNGAGLGGGSSDAATVLKWLASTLDPMPSAANLEGIALKVGADVPFFLKGVSALVKGIGEKVRVCAPIKLFLVVVKPPFSVLTKDAYRWFDTESKLTRRPTNATSRDVSGSLNFGLQDIVNNLDNDLEKPVEERHPEITRLKKAFRESGALGSQMSGSGSSVFGIFESAEKSEEALLKLRRAFPGTYTFFSCRTLT